ncbi:MAG: ABC transporter ATP-binding protein [Christensenellales bacterium]
MLKKEVACIRFALHHVLQCCPLALIIMMLNIPINAFVSVCEIYIPKLALDIVYSPTSMNFLKFVLIGIALVALYTTRSTINARIPEISSRICNHIKYIRMEKILRCNYAYLERENFRFIMQRALEATWQTNGSAAVDGILRTTASLISNIVCYIVVGSILLTLNPIILIILTITPIVHYMLARHMQNVIAKHKVSVSTLDRKLNYIIRKCQDMTFQKDIRVFGMREWLISLYNNYSFEHRNLDKKITHAQMLIDIMDGLLILLRDGAAYAILLSTFIKGQIDLSQFVMYFTSIAGFATWIGGIIDDIVMIERKCEYVNDLMEFCNYTDDSDVQIANYVDGHMSPGKASLLRKSNSAPSIELKNVSYTYPGADKPQIDNLSFKVEPGMKLAIVGLNGAGKTTLIKIMCGLLKPDKGEVLIDGCSLEKYGQYKFELFSAVMQDFHIFPLTIKQNVACMADINVDIIRLEEALRNADMLDFVNSLPSGVNTSLAYQLNADAIELSGGQKQRIALARAIYKDAPILLLDEPTAALDAIAESKLYNKYVSLTQNKTSVFISHRMASTRFCDKIILLKAGTITEQGTHEQLMYLDGEYASLYKRQASHYKTDDTDRKAVLKDDKH